MPSKRCATSEKGSGNCSSAPVTNRMACQSRCEIRVQASRRRFLNACSRLSTPRNRAVWGLGCRSAGRLSKRITDDCGRALTCHVALSLASLRRLIRPPHREWSAASGRYGARSMHKTRRWKMTVDVDEGKKAEEQSRFLAQLQATLNVIPAYTWYAAPSGGLTFVNKRTADYLGLPKDQPLRCGIDIGAQWDDHIPLLHPDDHEKSRKSWSTCLRTGEFAEESFRVRNAQGGYRWFRSRVEPLRASDGTLLQWVGVNVDIEELKCAEQTLRESEYKLRQIIDTVPSLLWSAGPDGEPTHVSQRLLDYSGMRLEDFKHGGWEAFVHPADFPETAKAFYHAIQTGASYRAVHRLRRAADGEYRWHHARGEPLRDREGRIVQWYGLSVDIDEGKKAEDRLRRSEANLAEAQRLTHTGTAVLDARAMRYLHWSDEAYRIWGFNPLQGRPSRENMWQRIHPDDRDRVWEEVQEALRQKRDFSSEFRLLLPDGTIKYLEAATYHEFSSSGALAEAASTQIDRTERKRAKDEHERLRQLESDLAHMNRLSRMGELAASLIHEITQPIGSARNNALAALNFFDKQPPDLSEIREALGCVVGDADRVGHIVDRIRDQIKKAPPRKDRVDVNEAINEVIVLARNEITTNGVSIRTRLAEALLPVQGDHVQLQQVVLNLILNAVEAMSTVEAGARELLISTEQTQTGGVLVSVGDSGPGIDPDHVDRVFEAFHTTKSSGVGMGLSICRSIIDAHGGRLWATRCEPRGALFQFTIPAD